MPDRKKSTKTIDYCVTTLCCSMWRTASGWNDRAGHIWGVVVLSLTLATAASSLHIQDYSEMEDMYERPQR